MEALIIIAYILLGLGVLTLVVTPIYSMVVHKKFAVRSFVGIGIIVLIFIIGYFASSGEIDPRTMQDAGLTESGVKSISAGVIVTYVLAIAAFLAIIVSEVLRIIKIK